MIQDILIYNAEYKLYRDGEYIGNAFWKEDENVGDSFQTIEDGFIVVWKADEWELIPKNIIP